jgi:NAD(P)-dependent dehydrogenase (short-subunit alcohol dehydrogenase family)
MPEWTFADIPDQAGRTVVVTGANGGLGFVVARMFALKGATVVLACRDRRRATEAADRIRAERPIGSAETAGLDLADLDAVRGFADAFAAGHDRLDVLINNAAVMWPPLSRTRQGFELQFGTNHLGHFALTGRLLPRLLRTPGARVTTTASLLQFPGRIDLDDLNWERRRYSAGAAYAQSKLANMLFAQELHRRLPAGCLSTACHPGWTSSQIMRSSPAVIRIFGPLLGQRPEIGALSTLRAATDPGATGGSYWGPRGPLELRGYPEPARIPATARDPALAKRLWAESVRLTGVDFGI